MKRPSAPALLALGSAALLALLGLAWVNSPAVGAFPVLALWTLPAAALAGWGRRGLGASRSLLPGRRWAVALAGLWLLLLWTAWVELGSIWVLDGLILREPRWTEVGRVVTWIPFALALLFALAMLGLALEGRYRLMHPEKYRAKGP